MGRLRQAKLALPGVIDPNQAIFGRRVLGAGGHQPDADPALRQMEPNRRGCLILHHKGRRDRNNPCSTCWARGLRLSSPWLTLRARPSKTFWLTSRWQQRRDFRIVRLGSVDDDAPPDVSVDRAPVCHHVNSVTGRMRFDCAYFQRPQAHRARKRLHGRFHAAQQGTVPSSHDDPLTHIERPAEIICAWLPKKSPLSRINRKAMRFQVGSNDEVASTTSTRAPVSDAVAD